MTKALKGQTYEDCLRLLALFSLEKRMLRGDVILAYNFLTEGSGGGRGGAALLSLVTCDGAQENGMKLCQEEFRLDTRKRFFTEKVVDHWSRLSREVDMAPKPHRVQGVAG
ncbi:hypothetical protein DUI87_08250 [Hirundo rustica rustica]|uniref:Uncharacterized protein n=1 Tax=Hirundo rustica rustica TaxID=333673 RepID=A0A3M0KSA4_HIRRU|nr:hypothetical protein DUI87_08250 [Hirundo rustica rustica]